MIRFRLDPTSGLPPYLQIVRQVRQAMRLGRLGEGDRLPTVRGVVARLEINQNTVLKAYRELESDGLVTCRPGVGTFVRLTLADPSRAAHEPLHEQLRLWLTAARHAGLDAETIEALFDTAIHDEAAEPATQKAS